MGVFCYLVIKSCLTFCDPMDCSLPGSSVHGIFQARILEWVAVSFSGDLFQVEFLEGFEISEVIDISPDNLGSSLCFFQPNISHDVLCIEVK